MNSLHENYRDTQMKNEKENFVMKKRRTVQRFLAVCLCLIVVISACACASTDVDAPSGESAATEESKETSALELSEMNAESTSTEAEPSDESSENESSTPDEHISADSDATLSEDITITPIEPTYPEERETTLELVKEYPVGVGGIPYYLVYETGPEYAGIEMPYDYCLDEKGNLYANFMGCLWDLQTNTSVLFETSDVVAAYLYAYDGKIYYTATDGTLNVFSPEKGVEFRVRIFESDDAPYLKIFPTDGGIPMAYHDTEFFDAKGKKVSANYSVQMDEGIASVAGIEYHLGEKKSARIVGNMDGILTVRSFDTEKFADKSVVGEIIYYQYDSMGNPISEFAIYELKKREYFPCQLDQNGDICKWYIGFTIQIGKYCFESVMDAYYMLGTDNQIYALIIYPDRAELYRINPGYSDVTPIDFDNAQSPMASPDFWEGLFATDVLATTGGTVAQTTAATATTITHIDLSPYEVQTRANAMVNLKWTLQAEHKNTNGCKCSDVTHAIQLPRYLCAAVNGQEMTGIPYCWGGFNGIDAASSGIYGTSFLNAITRTDSNGDLYITGNINSNPIGSNNGHCDFTIGLDCSGFVSSAYGLTSKHSVSMLRGVGHQKTNIDDLNSMDALLFFSTNGNHCYLFVRRVNDTRYRVMDCTAREKDNDYDNQTTMDNCTSERYISRTRVEDCEYYSPFYTYDPDASPNYHTYSCASCGITNRVEYHVWSEMQADSVYHTKKCTICGYTVRTAHTFTYTPDLVGRHAKSCATCGYTATELHTYSTEYSFTMTQHWQTCTRCGTPSTRTEHTLNYEYSTTQHWQTCETCGHTRPKTAHTYNTYGVCTACGYRGTIMKSDEPELPQDVPEVPTDDFIVLCVDPKEEFWKLVQG